MIIDSTRAEQDNNSAKVDLATQKSDRRRCGAPPAGGTTKVQTPSVLRAEYIALFTAWFPGIVGYMQYTAAVRAA